MTGTPERKPALSKAPVADHPLSPARSANTSASLKPPAVTVMLSARVPADVRDRLKLHAVRSRRSVQEILLSAVEEYLDKKDV